ncbi:MAG: hypothetical protein RL227_1285, partial [Pseudomonadota bacterium]
LTLRTPQFTRQTNLVHNDLPLFTEESMKRNAEMPPELGACFYPASNQVINVLMELPAQVASLPMAPPPAAPAAPGGGYVPPMVSTPAPAPTVVQATPAPMAAAPAPGVSSSGPIDFAFGTMEMNPERYHTWNSDIVGTIGVDIRNRTAGNLRVAIIDPWPVMQLEGGLRMGFKTINGVAMNRQANASNCAGYASQFTSVRPGQTLVASAVFELRMGGRDAPMVNAARLTGELVVFDEATQRCTIEPLSTPRINVKMNR